MLSARQLLEGPPIRQWAPGPLLTYKASPRYHENWEPGHVPGFFMSGKSLWKKDVWFISKILPSHAFYYPPQRANSINTMMPTIVPT